MISNKTSVSSVTLHIFASHTASSSELAQIENELRIALNELGLEPNNLVCKPGSTEIIIEFFSFATEKIAAGAVGALGALFFNFFARKRLTGWLKGFHLNEASGRKTPKNSISSDVSTPCFEEGDSKASLSEEISHFQMDYLNSFPEQSREKTAEATGEKLLEHCLAATKDVVNKSLSVETILSRKTIDANGNCRIETYLAKSEGGQLIGINKNISIEFPEK